jgi:methylmalonyl-CoA mutase C-terminal domain/subunit
MLAALDDADLDIPLIIGGIIPEADVPVLEDAGVAAILGPGAPADEVVAAVRGAVAARA